MGATAQHETTIIGVDPHRRTFTATALSQGGCELGHGHFDNSAVGHAALLEWASSFAAISRAGIEGASGLSRPLAEFLVDRGIDVRDVPPHRTAQRGHGRHEGKSDRLDSARIAAETQTNGRLAHAFKQSQGTAPDAVHDQMGLWHNARTSLRKTRVQLIGELDAMIHDLPEPLRAQLPTTVTVRARVKAIATLDTTEYTDPVVLLRLQLIEHRVAMLTETLAQDKIAETALNTLVAQAGTTLVNLVGSPPAPPPRSSWRPATSAASPRQGSRGSPAPHPSPPHQERAVASRCVTASTAAATGA